MAEPTAVHNLFDFKNCVMKMSKSPGQYLDRLQGKTKTGKEKIYIFIVFKITMYQSSGESSGCFRLKHKAYKTFNIILSTKCGFLHFALREGHCSPAGHRP